MELGEAIEHLENLSLYGLGITIEELDIVAIERVLKELDEEKKKIKN